MNHDNEACRDCGTAHDADSDCRAAIVNKLAWIETHGEITGYEQTDEDW